MSPWLFWALAKVLAPYELTLPTDLDATLFLLPEALDIIDLLHFWILYYFCNSFLIKLQIIN